MKVKLEKKTCKYRDYTYPENQSGGNRARIRLSESDIRYVKMDDGNEEN